ncbi:MAG TPA: class I SAM-dependent methyltransferase [Anaerolineales bacterium]|nr:class I SAM-dependent methyltransferase [Anaerolineales bacterium]HNB35646.1 class I SAM-dependent methyltransferase [Anaerolineales bacterium]HNC08630.1 class I SAM-dependent methyltransferase [Anaerolineales bacterium]
MDNTAQHMLENDIRQEYGLGPTFLSAYIKRWFSSEELTAERMKNLKGDVLLYTWFSFGLSTNMRGRMVAGVFQSHVKSNMRRYLDVGCGYGGFMVAFKELGLDVYGFELDASLVALSKANLADYGIPTERATVGDVLDDGFLKQLGTFDVITCNDVIEHVDNVDLAIKNMTNMLNPSGILILQIPNKDYVESISHDSHYNVFGITLLRHAEAEQYHKMAFGDAYTVGEYYEFEHYRDQLTQYGCEVTLFPPLYPPPPHPRKGIKLIIKDFLRTPKGLVDLWKGKKLTWNMKLKVSMKYLAYVLQFIWAGFLSIFSKREKEHFHIKYMQDFWVILAVKK